MISLKPHSKIIIFCPPRKVTGGPEALHQLSDMLHSIGTGNVFMKYLPWKPNPKAKNYEVYHTEEIRNFRDSEENILIIPESMTHLIKKYPKSQKIVWWLSVDFYKILMDYRIRKQTFITKPFYRQDDKEYHFEPDLNVFHWAQSFRSGIYLKNHGVPEEKIDFVCDYIHPGFFKNNISVAKDFTRKTVLYNPKKGKDEISLLIKNSPHLEWIPIQKMNSEQVRNLMAKSPLYVDFGENPGRDKMLRESVSQDCCIISGKKGSSAYYEDLMIPDDYKFDFTEAQIPEIIKKIDEVLENYTEHLLDFLKYKQMVQNEEATFEQKLRAIFRN